MNPTKEMVCDVAISKIWLKVDYNKYNYRIFTEIVQKIEK